MAGRVAGRVVFVTGAARGQGRSHAVRFAQEGADVIAMDVCETLPGMFYPGGTQDELNQTAKLVADTGQQIVTFTADIREYAALDEGLRNAVTQLGRLDFVIANAGIGGRPTATQDVTDEYWNEVIGVNLTGTWHTAKASIPHLIANGDAGGAMVLISSSASLRTYPDMAPYIASKHGVTGLMKSLALDLGKYNIRVNSIHPTTVDTPMIQNETMYGSFRPDLPNPSRGDFAEPVKALHVLPIPWIDPVDVSNAALFLLSDEARFITGASLPVDAGVTIK